jgi:hypothetical protein
MKSSRFTIVLIASLPLALAGCGLFSTRPAEAPDSGRSSWETPRLPGDVLTNLSNAMFERNAVNYLKSFDANTFSFEADNEALVNDPSLADWHYDDESQYITSLLSEGTLPRDSVLFVIFTSPTETILQDSAEIVTLYDLTAGVALAGAPHHLAGTAHFYLHMGIEGYWLIYDWADARTQEQSTWSNLKSLVP